MILDDPFEDFPALEDKNRCASPEPTDEILEVKSLPINKILFEDIEIMDY